MASQKPRPDATKFFLWSYIKENVFQHEVISLVHLKTLINETIAKIEAAMLKRVFKNMKRKIQACKQIGGGHAEHFI